MKRLEALTFSLFNINNISICIKYYSTTNNLENKYIFHISNNLCIVETEEMCNRPTLEYR